MVPEPVFAVRKKSRSVSLCLCFSWFFFLKEAQYSDSSVELFAGLSARRSVWLCVFKVVSFGFMGKTYHRLLAVRRGLLMQ